MKVVSKQGHNGQFGKFPPGEYDISLKENEHIKRAYAKFPHTFEKVAAAKAPEAVAPKPPVERELGPQVDDVPEPVKPAPKPKPKARRKPSGKAVTPG